MDERAFYTEKEETRKVKLVCPSCRGEFEAPVRWKVCRKKKELPRGIGEEDRRKFAKASSYMVRLDDLVACLLQVPETFRIDRPIDGSHQ